MTEWCSRAENSALKGVIGKACLWRKKITASVKLRLMWHSNFSFKSSVSSHLTFSWTVTTCFFAAPPAHCAPRKMFWTVMCLYSVNETLINGVDASFIGYLYDVTNRSGINPQPGYGCSLRNTSSHMSGIFLIGSFSGRLSSEGTHCFLQTQYGLKSGYIIFFSSSEDFSSFYNKWLEQNCSFFNSSKKHGVIIVKSSGVSPTLIPDPFTNKTKFLRRKSLLSA